jgi:hypothetical protein
MAGFDGLGNFNLLYTWTIDAANNVNILASRQDQQWALVVGGFQNCITRDGQGKPSADISWNSHKITNLAAATNPTDVPQFQQITNFIGGKNYAYNSAFSVWQRLTSGSTINPGTGAYTADRWYCVRASGGAAGMITTARSQDTNNPFGTAIQFGRSNADALSTQDVWLIQPLESIDATKIVRNSNFIGTMVTQLSCYVKLGSTTPAAGTFSLTLEGNLTQDAAPTAAGWTGVGTFTTASCATLSTVLYNRVVCLAATGGMGADYLSLRIRIGISNSSATAGADDGVYVTGVKLEQFLSSGSTTSVTKYDPPLYCDELNACKRYYQVYGTVVSEIVLNSYDAAAATNDVTYLLPVSMRTTPTATIVGGWGVTNCSSPVIPSTKPTAFILRTTVTALGHFTYTSPAGVGITLSAEL